MEDEKGAPLIILMHGDREVSTKELARQIGAKTVQPFQPAVAQRILDAPDKLANAKEAFRLSELYDTLQGAIWSELKGDKDVSVLRRNLQRERLRQISGQVLRANSQTPADARALAREGLRGLQAQLKAAAVKPGSSKETKAHFADCLAIVEESLKAGRQRMSL